MRSIIISSIIFFAIFASCTDGNKFNVFSIEQDKQLGAQVSHYIESSASHMELLDSVRYASAYQHLYRIRDYVLASEKIEHRKDFLWKTRIIKNDSILNAFATPGGYIYVYTGLIKYLETEDELAGVLAHEVAHADQRHTTAMLTKNYGIDLLLRVILGNDYRTLIDISENLIGRSFSRDAEEDADKHSVIYLCRKEGKYRADGAAGFFSKMIKEDKSGQSVEFLSTHPNPPNRIERIQKIAEESGCDTKAGNSKSYTDFKNSLP